MFGLTGHIRDGRVGVWSERPDNPKRVEGSLAEHKIPAFVIRLRQWVSYHGLSVYV